MYLLERFRSHFIRFSLAGCFFILLIASSSTAFGQQTMVIFQDDFESGIGDWSADNGLWEVGAVVVGPDSAYSGQKVAGTVLSGNYVPNANTRFISPEISLPSLSGNEKHILKFWNWFNTEDCCDKGIVQISTDGATWDDISTFVSGAGLAWTQQMFDLSAYASSKIRVAFFFSSNSGSRLGSGWYIDDILVEKRPLSIPNPEGFETGIGDWSVDNGLWEVGMPSSGPGNAHSGQIAAGTVLSGNYAANANTRLISPEMRLKSDTTEVFELRFFEWFSTEDCCDMGVIQISVDGGEWNNTKDDPISGGSVTWTQRIIDLSEYTGSLIRIAFYFTSNSGNRVGSGWYIDDMRIEGIVDSVTTSVDESEASTPTQFVLQQNYPNPFNPTTTIRYQLPKSAPVVLTIYNLLGREIRKVVDGNQSVGGHAVRWDGRDHVGKEVASGVYVYRLDAGSFHQTRKMLLLR